MNIYVGNLSHDVTDEELRQEFEAYGQITSVNVIKDKYSGESRGFGFVEMPAKAEAQECEADFQNAGYDDAIIVRLDQEDRQRAMAVAA